jgi:hypothetical protein
MCILQMAWFFFLIILVTAMYFIDNCNRLLMKAS